MVPVARVSLWWLVFVCAQLIAACPSFSQGEQTPTARTDCFELVVAQQGTPPGSPMLVNKCNGHTFILVAKPSQRTRNGKSVRYVWEAIPVADSGADLTSNRPALGKECFTYDDRVFCK
jgi:hypothetical protein